jgi:hypothetical protein
MARFGRIPRGVALGELRWQWERAAMTSPNSVSPRSSSFGPEEEAFLALLGPSWAAMTPAQRAAYGPEHESRDTSHGLLAIDAVVDLALRFPRCIRDQGFLAIARRLRYRPAVLRLAEQLDNIDDLDALAEESDYSAGLPLRRAG